MPRTIDSIVDNHRAARALRSAGKPIWTLTIDIKSILREDPKNTTDEHCAQVANRIAALIRLKVPAKWLDVSSDASDDDLFEVVDGMEALKPDSYEGEPDFSPAQDLNSMLDQLYDWADKKRVWLG